MFYFKLIFMVIMVTSSFAGVEGSYEINFTNHPLFHKVRLKIDNKAEIVNYELIGDLADRSNISSSYKQIEGYDKQTGFLTIHLDWLNDGSSETTKIEIFISNDKHFSNSLISVVTVYSDGSTSVELDKNATLRYIDSAY